MMKGWLVKIVITKTQMIDDLTLVYRQWLDLLASLDDEQVSQRLAPSPWAIKDVVAHLWFWQQASVARMEAALQDKQPNYPDWWEIFAPDPEEDVDRTNAWNYEHSRAKPWVQVYSDWKTQYQHYLDLHTQIREEDLLAAERFTWMGKYRLIDSSLGSCDHHREHYELLVIWLKQHANLKTGE
jgi:hypothetical protein